MHTTLAPTNSALAWADLYEAEAPAKPVNKPLTPTQAFWATRDLSWDGDLVVGR